MHSYQYFLGTEKSSQNCTRTRHILYGARSFSIKGTGLIIVMVTVCTASSRQKAASEIFGFINIIFLSALQIICPDITVLFGVKHNVTYFRNKRQKTKNKNKKKKKKQKKKK